MAGYLFHGMKQSITLTAGQYLKLDIEGDTPNVSVFELASGVQTALSTITTEGTASLGPYTAAKTLILSAYDCRVEYAQGTAAASAVGGADLSLPSGVSIISGAGVPVDYTDGDPAATGEGWAKIGSIYIDYTNGKLYVNGGTMAQPLWKIVTSAA